MGSGAPNSQLLAVGKNYDGPPVILMMLLSIGQVRVTSDCKLFVTRWAQPPAADAHDAAVDLVTDTATC